jgi:hypothetical protein
MKEVAIVPNTEAYIQSIALRKFFERISLEYRRGANERGTGRDQKFREVTNLLSSQAKAT